MVDNLLTRQQVARILQIDEGFIIELEEELIVAPSSETEGPCYTSEVCERIRIAHELVHELEVNLAGASIILQMRDQMTALRRQFHATLDLIREAAKLAERRRGGRRG